MSSLKFGTSGLRGLVVDLVGRLSYAYTLAFLQSAGAPADPATPVLVGRDLRASSPEIAASVLAAARDAGLQGLDCGALPTPALALEAMRLGAPAIMVTGSHIPEDRNGLKFYTARGEITKDDEAAILAALPPEGTDAPTDRGQAHPEALARFRDRCIGAFAPGALAGMRVGVYEHSTVARDLLPDVLAALGAAVVPFGRADTFVPVDTEAHRPEDLAAILDTARQGRFDAIVTTDGDGDRPLVADAAGKVLRGDVVGLIAARHLGIAALAVPVTVGSAVERSGGFAQVVRTRVGSPYVIEGMERARRAGVAPVAGFEANGGFLLGSDLALHGRTVTALPTRDSMLPILATLVAARSAGLAVADLVTGLGAGAAASDRLKNVPAERSGRFLAALADAGFRATFLAPVGREVSVDELDGVRILLDGGTTMHFRASGNAPELRCYVEAESLAEAERLVAWGLASAGAAMQET